MTEYPPEIISPVELVQRVHQKYATLIMAAARQQDAKTVDNYQKADDILVNELETMHEEAINKIANTNRG